MSLKDSGNYHYKNRDYAKAIDYYLKSIKANPNESAVYYNLAMSQFQLQRYEEAITNCTEALRLEPSYKKALYRRMHSYAKLGKYLEAILDGRRYLELEDPKQDSFGEARRELLDFKVKLIEESAPPDHLKVKIRKRSALPAYLLDIRAMVRSDAVGLLYLRQSLKKIYEGLQLPLSTEDLSQLEEIKILVCQRLLELEAPENCLDLVDIVLSLTKVRQHRLRTLRKKVEIARTLKSDEIALAALRELYAMEGSKALMKEIEEYEVATDEEDDKKEQLNDRSEQQKDSPTQIRTSSLSPDRKVGEYKSEGINESKEVNGEITSSKKITQEEQKQKEPEVAKSMISGDKPKQPVPKAPIKKASKKEQAKQSQPEWNSDQKSELEATIRSKFKRLEKQRQFSDYIDILEKLSQLGNPTFTAAIMEDISKLSCFDLLQTGLSGAEKQLVKGLAACLPHPLDKKYQP